MCSLSLQIARVLRASVFHKSTELVHHILLYVTMCCVVVNHFCTEQPCLVCRASAGEWWTPDLGLKVASENQVLFES